jgi:hypothetical protein
VDGKHISYSAIPLNSKYRLYSSLTVGNEAIPYGIANSSFGSALTGNRDSITRITPTRTFEPLAATEYALDILVLWLNFEVKRVQVKLVVKSKGN